LKADENRHEAHHVELVFRDEYLARADMWRLAVSELSKRTVYRGQKLLFMGSIKATIKQIYIDGQSVHSGYFSPTTKVIFRSESARYVLFIQMSREMWDFDAEGAGEIMFNKVVSGFLPDLFKRWLRINARHLVTIILFTRMEYDDDTIPEQSGYPTSNANPESHTGSSRDYYRVVVSDMASGDWVNILYQLKKEFRSFLREVSLVPKFARTMDDNRAFNSEHSNNNTVIAGKPSSASQGNILEAINMAASQFAKDYIDRDLVRTGISVIVVTPGTGVFEVDYNLLKLTTDTLIGSGIGIDLVCLSPVPLHSVPLFKYRTPLPISQTIPGRDKRRRGSIEIPKDQDDKTPRQYQPNFGSMRSASTMPPIPSPPDELTVLPNTDTWQYAMPYWVDVSFWSGASDDTFELTKPGKIDKSAKKSRKKRRSFALRCRLYELQMMGVLENELGDISIPYMDEDPRHAHPLCSSTEKQQGDKDSIATPRVNPTTSAIGSYSSRGDKDFGDDHLDETSHAYKSWMESYDNEAFAPLEQLQLEPRPPRSDRGLESEPFHGSPDTFKTPSLSTSFRSSRASIFKTGRPNLDGDAHSIARESLRALENPSPRANIHQFPPQKGSAVPRADVLQRQKAMARNNTDSPYSTPHGRKTSGGLRDYPKPTHSTTSSRAHSPVRKSEPVPPPQPPPPQVSVTPSKTEAKNRPSNWFLRQISFGGKAAPAKATISDATIDITRGKVKPAMLTVENNQRGPIEERLASTRLTSTEKPSQPITIRSSSRTSLSSNGSPISDRGGRSVETVRDMRASRTSIPSHPSSVIKDPGSTFLLAGSRAVGDNKPKPDLSSSGGAKEAPRTLSPTTAIAPWAVLVNPCNPKKNTINSMNQYRRWHHVFPRTLRTGTVKWRSLCSPAAVPLTHEWFPSAEQLASEYNESPYKITQNDDDEMIEVPKNRESLIRELIAFRLSHGFQIIVGAAVAEFSGRQEKSLASIFAPEYMSADGDTVFMTVGTSIHQLVCVAGGEVEVKRYTRKPTTALESSAGIGTPFPYKPYIRTAFEPNYDPRNILLQPPRNEYNWNFIDTFLAGYHEELSETLRFWRTRFVLIPVEIPALGRRPLPTLADDSEEEIRLEGIRKLTQVWQRYRYLTPEERHLHAPASTNQKDLNPLAIEYHTRDPSACIAAGHDHVLFNDSDTDIQPSLFSDAEKYHSSNIDLKKLADDLQGEKGIQMLDRRWHWKLYYNCFLGFDLTNWLLSNFKDIDSREGAIELGNQLMEKGLFQHVRHQHQFRDGNFFFQLAPEYRAPRTEPRMGWFGMRKTDRSVPSTPLLESARTSPLMAKSTRSRPSTGDSSSTSASAEEGEKTPTRNGTPKRKVVMSRVMRYDVDPRKRSYRPEIISLHYGRLHNPDNCYHIRIDWMNVTAKLIEDAIVTWATSVEKYGLKLVEVPIAEAANIADHHPFRSPYMVKLALQPPHGHPEAMWDSSHFSPQYSKMDRFAYHKALLRKLNFVLDMEAAKSFPSDVEVTYSWGNLDYKYTQFIHRSGGLLVQITDDGNFLLLANRLAHSRAKDLSRIRPVDPYEHKKATTDGSQSSRLPSTPAIERGNPHRSPFSSPLVRPVQDSSLLFSALQERQAAAQASAATPISQTPEQVKDELEAFCSNAELLSQFYGEALRQAPSPSPRLLPVLDDKIPSLGLPPAINVREASPANSGWLLGSSVIGRGAAADRFGGISDVHSSTISGIAGRRQNSESSMSTLSKRGSVAESSTAGSVPKRQDSQGSSGM
jgi:hypothetical protein